MKLHIAIDTAREQTLARGIRHSIASLGAGDFATFTDDQLDQAQLPAIAWIAPHPAGTSFRILDDRAFFGDN